MRLFCAGFNLYGQYHNLDEICIDTFKNTHYENVIDLEINQLFSIAKEFVIEKLSKNLKTEVVFDGFPNERIPHEKELHLDIKPDSTEIPKTKLVFHGFLNEKSCQEKELFFDREVEVTQISLSDNAALFLTNRGEIWSLKYRNRTHFDVVLLPNLTQIEPLDNTDQIVKIACGRTISCASTRNGCIYNIPSKLDCKIMNVKDIRCGREHCLILTENGLVYSFGGGSRGQLGHGDVENLTEPKLIDNLGGIQICKIACGGWHSVALSSEGDVYIWGWNSNGQLGLKTNENDDNDVSIMASPQVINFDINIIDIECGSRHTIALSENSLLYGCGWNKYCQLGYTSIAENCYCMKEIYDFSNIKITSLKCGTWSTAVLVSD